VLVDLFGLCHGLRGRGRRGRLFVKGRMRRTCWGREEGLGVRGAVAMLLLKRREGRYPADVDSLEHWFDR
jgi:hypothetical protein